MCGTSSQFLCGGTVILVEDPVVIVGGSVIRVRGSQECIDGSDNKLMLFSDKCMVRIWMSSECFWLFLHEG